MIKLTVAQCTSAFTAVTQLGTLPAPPKVAYRVSKLLRQLKAEHTLYVEQRNALVKEFGVERPATPAEREQGVDGPVTEVKPENIAEFAKQLAELDKLEVTIENAQPLKLEDIEAFKELRADVIAALGPCLEEPA